MIKIARTFTLKRLYLYTFALIFFYLNPSNSEKNGMIDAMYIFIETKEFGEFLKNEAYK
tara:strand:- start:12 stop:188 length:177 start_codon:yes stop_codon:yes gene_type:complete